MAAGLLADPGHDHRLDVPGPGLGGASAHETQRARRPPGGPHPLQLGHGGHVGLHVP